MQIELPSEYGTWDQEKTSPVAILAVYQGSRMSLAAPDWVKMAAHSPVFLATTHIDDRSHYHYRDGQTQQGEMGKHSQLGCQRFGQEGLRLAVNTRYIYNVNFNC